ncbi:Plasminogen,Hepatocyte growth factor-like protein,Hepatocyte growth factor [Mytilus edulis]|uniref:Plasminogen,Hepatocyte growth factor-like protein,Hepatocyte growth factor n=1 Tax=Mytilus edulis TaxID=6550 RepID=A0A8S3R778_MYTED|nr:Plasminogen,Hepatocyte growth factor-like protein,Hepatocyte growth factor [Mytilus edulis]
MDARLGFFLFLLVTVLQTVVESGYIGCYQDDSTRILHNEVLKDKGTPSDCRKCHIHGTCERGRCRCKRGYTGDGINVCSKSCTCSASGDPHYRTFDGQVLHFMGTCKYTLSQYVNPSSRCRFHVQVKNENRGNTQVSFTRSVHVVVRQTKIDLLKNNVVKVDGIKIYLPYKTRYFSIIYSGRYVRLKTTCKVLITWDGNSAVTISVPSQFSRNLIGLCGNCNGIKDDFRTKDGLDVRTKPDKFTLIGESYLIREGTSKKCGVTTPPDPCTSALRNKANGNSACGQLNPANPSSSFKDCSQVDTALVQDIYNTCVYDYCAYSDHPDILNTIVCEAAEGLEERCENMGVSISWRTKQFCPFICEGNMEYSSAVSGCPATCVDIHAPIHANYPDQKDVTQCGCKLSSGEYFPIDTETTSRDCGTVSRCVATKSGDANMQVIRRQKCNRNAQCKILNGVYDCVCEEGFKGDGIKQCKECRKSTKGTEYKGRISLTQTGRSCQYWERQHPHKHVFSNLKTEHNYCRNPDNSGQPWCYTNDPTTRWEYCKIPMCECRKSTKGTEYKGRISLTQTGRSCQYWERQHPHKHVFSNLKTEHNYCRNPDNSGQPWCYTNDPTTRWEYCKIPMCDSMSL